MWRPRSRWAGTVWPMWPRCVPSPSCSATVASDPTISRLIATLADDVDAALSAIRGAHARARAAAWARRRPLAGTPGSRAGGQVVVDIDATLVAAHSDKESAAPTYKRGYGFHPMLALTTTAMPGPARRWWGSCGPGRPRRGRRATTSVFSTRPWSSSPRPSVARCWSVLTPVAARRRSWVTSPTWAWSTRSGPPPTTASRPRSRRSRPRLACRDRQ